MTSKKLPASEVIYVRVPARIKAQIEHLAAREARTLTAQVGEIFRTYFKEHPNDE